MADAAALGLAELGPVAAGAEPGTGMKTPWASAAPAQMSVSQAVVPTNQRLTSGGMASSRLPTSGTDLTCPRPADLGRAESVGLGEYRRFQASPRDEPACCRELP